MFEKLLQHLISRYMGALANWRWRFFKNWSILRLIRKHHVDMIDVAEADINKYENFNQFFIRKLKPESRPIASEPHAIASPVDGFVSQVGTIRSSNIIQAKGMDYTVSNLLGKESANYEFDQGSFITQYLSPSDYHRVHMSMTGQLKEMIYIPGCLFSVSPEHVQTIPALFARNERVVCLFENEIGWMAQVLVGAMVVGSIEVPWAGVVTSGFWGKARSVKAWDYSNENIILEKGEEMGRFLLGSTAITLFSKEISWNQSIRVGDFTKMGSCLGDYSLALDT